jgi:hypothetical protein
MARSASKQCRSASPSMCRRSSSRAPSSSGDLCLLLLLGLCGCDAELLVRQMGRACDGVGVIGGRLRGRLLGLGARIMVEVLFIDESGVQICLSPTSRVPSARGRWPGDSRYFPSAGRGLLNAYVLWERSPLPSSLCRRSVAGESTPGVGGVRRHGP